MGANSILLLNLAFKLLDLGVYYMDVKKQIEDKVKAGATEEEVIRYLEDETVRLLAEADKKIADIEAK